MCSTKALRHAKGDCGDKNDDVADQETQRVGRIVFGMCWYVWYIAIGVDRALGATYGHVEVDVEHRSARPRLCRAVAARLPLLTSSWLSGTYFARHVHKLGAGKR